MNKYHTKNAKIIVILTFLNSNYALFYNVLIVLLAYFVEESIIVIINTDAFIH